MYKLLYHNQGKEAEINVTENKESIVNAEPSTESINACIVLSKASLS